MITHTAPLERGCVAGPGEQMSQTGARPERRHVIGGAVGVGPGLPVPGDQAVDQAGVTGRHRLEVEAEALQRTGAQIGHENIRIRK